jgi:hypothetical protein
MRIFSFIVLLGLFLAMVSCLDTERKGYYREIDSMLAGVDSMEMDYGIHPLDSLQIIVELASSLEKQVKANFNEDTVDTQFAKKMNKLRGIRKGNKEVFFKKAFLDTIFRFQREQLTQLRSDIENSAGKRDQYGAFIDSERNNVNIIRGALKEFKLRFDAMRFDYYDINNEIKDRIEIWKSKSENK